MPSDIRQSEFETLDEALKGEGPGAALDRLIGLLIERGDSRALLDALLLKARHDLGLPLIQSRSLADLPEPERTRYEDRYVEAIRSVGRRLLDAGDVQGARPYFRAIAEKEPVAAALDAYEPAEADETLGPIVEIAFNQGAHPAKGFALILDHYGACSAITAFEHLPADEAVRIPCADRLVRNLHAQLTSNLRAEIARRGQPLPAEGTSIPALIAGRDWLFGDDAYHLDVSHLAATIRIAPILTNPETLGLAAELADYGRNLSERYRYEGQPPFEHLYDDHAIYLRALRGEDAGTAIAHFRAKLVPNDPDGQEYLLPAQVLVLLLVRLDRLDEAIDVAAQYLDRVPDSALICPSLAQLCQRAGRPDRLATLARDQGDLVNYAAAILQTMNDRSRMANGQ